jgi:hypothetical protein
MVDELRDQEINVLTEPADLVKPGRSWNGYETWQCTMCPYNDTDRERTVGHVMTIHLQEEPKKQKIQSSLVDPSGRPIFMEV